ncbi:hypothetical protein LguiA_030482 [Lonicera macranthoides]
MYREGFLGLPSFSSSIVAIATAVAAIFFFWFLFKKREVHPPKIPTAIPNNNTSTTAAPSTSESSSASTADLARNYEVFLNFRGTDTRESFTDFLYTYLVGAGIHTFRDDNELRIGEEISPELLKAIKESKISIPIFSKNYASSKWCLLELAQMVECHANEGQKIFPIFYDVDASDVRNQKGSYEEAFRLHEKKFDENTVQRWRDALRTVGQLKGYELDKETNGYEGELVKKVVRSVLLQLKKNYTHVPDELVGMDHHVEEMTRLLHDDSDGVRIIGIHGMGGLGKTTIAKVIYNQLCESYEYCCFLEDVREKAKHQQDGLVNLQKQLVSRILKVDLPAIVDVDDGINKIKDAFHGKKVLIVLDDVDEKSQFDKLAGECSWFEKESKIIVTTRNKEVLNALEMTCIKKDLLQAYRSYEPDLMSDYHSLQLFSKYAFMRDSPPEDFSILSEKVVSAAAGLPLVLVVLGSLFFGNEDKDLWEEKLRELEKIPNEEVLKKLRISFEPLNDRQKCIFLDIACLFTGQDKANPCYMWDDCELYPRNGINTLVLRSLVKVGDDNTLRMHDQLRDLGREIVREENFNEPAERSRVWRPEEALDVLTGEFNITMHVCYKSWLILGTKYVEALNLDFGAVEQKEFEQLESYGKSWDSAACKEVADYERAIEFNMLDRYGELVNKVVKNVLLQLKKNYTHVPDELVGMDHHVEEMTRLLHDDSDGVRIIGIHGMGGLGKTTIAKAKHQQDGLVNLQKQLVSRILKVDLPPIVDVDDGINKIKDAFHGKKVLIVLDDVDEKSQFDKLAGKCSWFEKESKIIVTTRNKEVLNALEVTCIKKGLLQAYKSYEPELMNDYHSLQLFSKYAFMRDSPPEDYYILSKKVVSTAAGLPLILVVLGSLFFGNEDKDLWEEKLRELEKIPNEEVLKKLRISFEPLKS